MALHCPECGFVNPDGANYCQRCGALLGAVGGHAGDPTTATYRVGETGELIPVDLDDVIAHGAALVIRAGGGRVGRASRSIGERMTDRPPSRLACSSTTSQSRATTRCCVRRGNDWLPRRLRLAERHLRQPGADRIAPAGGRRRVADRQVQAHVLAPDGHRWPTTTRRARRVELAPDGRDAAARRAPEGGPRKGDHDRRGVQGARPGVPGHLDLQDPLPGGSEAAAPRRTPGGYRLYSQATSRGCARSCACSATSSCRCG